MACPYANFQWVTQVKSPAVKFFTASARLGGDGPPLGRLERLSNTLIKVRNGALTQKMLKM
jgi:hypothetical protein